MLGCPPAGARSGKRGSERKDAENKGIESTESDHCSGTLQPKYADATRKSFIHGKAMSVEIRWLQKDGRFDMEVITVARNKIGSKRIEKN